MRILVTGGAGFIGSHVAERLIRDGHVVEILDNLSDFYGREWKLFNLDEIHRHGDPKFHPVDICDAPAVDTVVEQCRPDAIIHLAADAGLRQSLVQPLRYERTNVHGTLCVLESCRKFGVERLLFASSSSVYGRSSRLPFVEDEKELHPLSPYAATKLAGESMCSVYAHLYNLHISCFRLFTVYGPRQRPDLAVRKFIEQIELGKPIVVYGDGSSGRDYTYVDDIVDGLSRALEYDCAFEIFNLGNSHPIALTEMIGTVEEAVGRKAIVQREEWHASETPTTWACIDKAGKLLGYAPKVDFRTGVRRAVEWLRRASAALQLAKAE